MLTNPTVRVRLNHPLPTMQGVLAPGIYDLPYPLANHLQ